MNTEIPGNKQVPSAQGQALAYGLPPSKSAPHLLPTTAPNIYPPGYLSGKYRPEGYTPPGQNDATPWKRIGVFGSKKKGKTTTKTTTKKSTTKKTKCKSKRKK